jgi:protein phosphatase
MSQLANPVASPTTIVGHEGPSPEHRPLAVRSFGLTDRGRVRPQNEDQFLIAELAKSLRVRQSSLPQRVNQTSAERGHLFLVADGVGGHHGGERASALAMQSIEDFVLNSLKWFFHLKGSEEQNLLKEFQTALRQADARLFAEAYYHPEQAGMGTTLTLAYSLDADLFIAHVGDSRCYLFRGGELHQLTRDHTLVAEMVREGLLAPEAAGRHRLRHVITNVVGGCDPGVEVEVHKAYLESGDILLLCSDGLTEMVPADRIANALAEETEPRTACERLVAEANERGGKDNITVIIARFADAGAA